MRKLSLFITFVSILLLAGALQAQEFDGAFGFGTVKAPAAGNGFPSQSGGLYPSFSGNVLFWHHLGVGGEVAWRARQTDYFTSFGIIPYRPLFYDFNAVYGRTSKKVGGDVMAGIGGEDLRFYTGLNCGSFSGCTNYQSANHFAFHVGGDIRYYVWGHMFVRPEAHYYVIHNSGDFQGGQIFNNGNASRFAVSIGYSFMPGF